MATLRATTARATRVTTRPPVAAHPAAGDCERIRPGLVAQPVNAASCLAYIAAGTWLWLRLRRDRARAGPGPGPGPGATVDPAAALYCGLVAANGLGGIAFHGPGDRASHWLHDTALVGTLAAMAFDDVPSVAGATVAAGLGIAVRPTATNAASVVGTALVAGAEVRRGRRDRAPAPPTEVGPSRHDDVDVDRGPTRRAEAGRSGQDDVDRGRARRADVRRSRPEARGRADGVDHDDRADGRGGGHSPLLRTGALLLAAAAVNVVSRTGGRCCRPASPWQGHALWHVLTAVALADWGARTFRADVVSGPVN